MASGYATMLRAELEKSATAFTARLASGKAKLNDMCPLDFFKTVTIRLPPVVIGPDSL